MQARDERSLRTNVPHNAKPCSGDIICLSDNIATAWLSLVGLLVSVSCARPSLAYGYSLITTAWLPKVETKNPVRDSTKITDRKCGESVATAVFRRIVYLPYHQPQSGLHKINTPMQPYPGLRLCGGRYPPEDSARCVRSAFPVGYFCGIPDGILHSLLQILEIPASC